MSDPYGFAPERQPPKPTAEWPSSQQWAPPTPPVNRSNRRAWVGAGLFVVAVAVVAILVTRGGGGDKPAAQSVAAISSSPATQLITGTLTLTDTDAFWTQGESCSGSGGYGDIDAGGQVTLTDDTGRIIGSTTLSTGTASSGYECEFSFAFGQSIVPTARFYSVEVTHRGKVTDSVDELRANSWKFGLSIGS